MRYPAILISMALAIGLVTAPTDAPRAGTHGDGTGDDEQIAAARSDAIAPEQHRLEEHRATHMQHDESAERQAELAELNASYDEAWSRWEEDCFGIEIAPGTCIADVGAGDGTLALQLAERTGPTGHVYANEIDPAKVVEIRERLLASDLRNVTPVLGAPADPLLPPGQIELLFLVEVWHHVDDPPTFLAATRRRLRPGARMIVIEADVARSQHESGCYSDPGLTRQRFRDAGFELASVERTILADCPFFVLTAIVPESR